MATATLPPPSVFVAPSRKRVVGITVDQYEFLYDQGKLVDPTATELIDGEIVRRDRSKRGGDPTMIGEEHAWVVTAIGELVIDLVGTGACVRCQQPMAIPPLNMPQPDGAIVRGNKDDYRVRHPRPASVLCVIEVADSSLDDDRTTKRAMYAAGGIAPYLIVNIPDRQIESHDGPQPDGTYANVRVVRSGETIDLPVGDGRTITIPADRLIPPALA